MACKFVILATTLAFANAGYLSQPAVATYSAATPVGAAYSSPSIISKSVSSTYQSHPTSFPTYAAPAQIVTKSVVAPAPAVYSTYSAPAPILARTVAATPVVAKSYIAPAPAVYSTYSAPSQLVAKTIAAPALYSSYSAPTVAAYSAPIISKAAPLAYAAAPALSYSSPVLAKTIAQPLVSSYGAPAW